MIFGKAKNDSEETSGVRPLESAAINRWRSINSEDETTDRTPQEEITEEQIPLFDSNDVETLMRREVEPQVQILSLDQVFEEDEANVVRLPDDRVEENSLFDYRDDYQEEDVNNLSEEREEIQEETIPLNASIEIEREVRKPKVPSQPPIPTANFSISSEEDLKARFGNNIQSALGSGTMIEGRFSFETPVRIDGSLRGEIKSSSALIVGKNAVVNARIKVGALIVLGSVEGEIEAEDLIEIRSSGSLLGEVVTKRIALEEGGVFSGSCTMLD